MLVNFIYLDLLLGCLSLLLLVLIRLSCQEYTPLRDLMVPLESRLNETNWVVVYKALLVFYLLFRDGDSRKIFEYVKKPFLEHLYLFRDVKRSLGKGSSYNGRPSQ